VGRAGARRSQLFEFLILEARRPAELDHILRKRGELPQSVPALIRKVAPLRQDESEFLENDEGIVANRLKIESAVSNAKAFLAVQKEIRSFDQYLWRFVAQASSTAACSMAHIPARTARVRRHERRSEKRRLPFVGSTICYAQCSGRMVNDHVNLLPLQS